MNGDQSTHRVLALGARYPLRVALLRVGIGIWLLALTVILYSSGHGGQWGWLLVVGAVLHFGLAYRLFRVGRPDPDRRMALR